jgi:hypothetical protein
MKTFFSFAYRGNAMLRFGCGIMSIASLTFVILSAQAGQPQRGVCIGAESSKSYYASCTTDCQARLYQCLVARTNASICYSNYSRCLSGCAQYVYAGLPHPFLSI